MKRNRKIKVILLLLTAVLLFTACSGDDGSESSEISVIAPLTDSVLSDDYAQQLVSRDREITEMFICCSLCTGDNGTAAKREVAKTSRYHSYGAITDLLSQTYTVAGGSIEFFIGYPGYGNQTLSEKDGIAYTAYHPGSGYGDFIDPDTVKVTNASDNAAIIEAKTESGTEVTLDAVYSEGKWLLEKGLYRTVNILNDYCEETLPYSGIGSCKTLSGKLLVVELFINDGEYSFDTSTENDFHTIVSEACGFIREECSRYGSELEITYANAYYEHSGVIASNTYSFDMMFAYTSFETLGGFIDANFELDDYDDYVVMVCLNKEGGTDYNRYESTAETELFDTERIFVRKDSSSEEVCKSLLYLYGAYAYDGDFCSEYINELFVSYFPDDIFVSGRMAEGGISRVTAFATGMTKELPPLLRVFLYNTGDNK